MARIRSIHPGLWTDEAFVTISPVTALVYIGLLNEADDWGVFEWKPIQIKMRLRPASAETADDIEALLTEMEQTSPPMIMRFEVDGKQYGAVRNFNKWQRPKKPAGTPPKDAKVRNFLFLNPDGSRRRAETGRPPNEASSEPVPNSCGTSSELSPQMEDGGDKREERTTPPSQARGGVVVLHPEEPENEIPAVLDRRAYPDKFEAVWDEYKPIASKNATKADAFRAWQKLSASDQQSCYVGVVEYAMWLQDERKRRPDTPAKHLATFINKRGWEPFEEADHATG